MNKQLSKAKWGIFFEASNEICLWKPYFFLLFTLFLFYCINYSSLVFHMCVVIFKAKINVGKWNIDDEFIAATKNKIN